MLFFRRPVYNLISDKELWVNLNPYHLWVRKSKGKKKLILNDSKIQQLWSVLRPVQVATSNLIRRSER